MVNVKVPKSLNLGTCVDFCNDLFALPDDDHYRFDFSEMGYITPFSLLYFSNQLKKYRQGKEQARFQAINHFDKGYAAHMGFFRAFGVRYGNEPGEALGNARYLPINEIPISEINQQAEEQFVKVGEVVEKHSLRLARILLRQKNGDVVDALNYSLREIMRNVVEHSQAESIYYAAQFWPTQHRVEIAILDTGVGVSSTLKNNPHLSFKTDIDALKLALLPGISSKFFKGIRRRKNDDWQNSGYGLFMTSQLCSRRGSFFIGSGGAGVQYKGNSKKEVTLSHKGTALRMIIDTNKIDNLQKTLNQIAREGRKIAKEIDGTSDVSASTASRMLLRSLENA